MKAQLMDQPAQACSGWVAIQRNPVSGSGRQYRPISELISELRRIHLNPRLYSCRAEFDAAVGNLEYGPPTAIVAAGGDGTVRDLLNRHPQLPVAILPLGTENLVARHLGIPRRNGRFVARMIADGKTQSTDLATVGPLRFAIMASSGFDSAVLHAAHAARTGHITRRHYLRPILNSFWSYDFPELRVTIDDESTALTGGMVVVANLPQYAFGLPLVPGANPADGFLDVRVFPHRSKFQLLGDLANVLCRSRRAGAAKCYRARRVLIESDRPLPVQADGDPAGVTPVEIGIIPQAGKLIIP